MQFGNLGGSSRRRIARLTSLARSIYARNNYDGALYLPREIASLFQTSTGTTPVAVATDPVGLVMDTRLGMAASTKGVYLSGAAGTYLSSPDSVAASITGDIDIDAEVNLTDWTPATNNWLVAKNVNAGQFAYDFRVNATTGVLVFRTTGDGTTARSLASTVAPTIADGAKLFVRVKRISATGAGTFYTSTDGVSWTQLGTEVAGTAGAIFDSTDELRVGAEGAVTSTGKIYSARIYNGIRESGGTLAVNYNGTDYVTGGTFPSSTTGEVWTLNGATYIAPDGNHAIQATAAARSTWTNRVNQKTASNDFTTGWTQQGTPTPTQDAVGIDGLVSAWTLTDNDAAATEAIYRQDQSYIAGVTYTHSVFVKKTTGVQTSFPAFSYRNSASTHAAGCNIDTTNGTALAWTSRTGVTIVTSSVVVESYNSDFWRVSLTFLAQSTDTTALVLFYPAFRASLDAVGDAVAAVTGSAVFTAQQIEFGTVATRYQRVTTATDFDTAGFPHYLAELGTDDNVASATGGGGTDGFYHLRVSKPTGGAGTLRTMFSDTGTNTGIKTQLDAANKLSLSAGNGAAFTALASTATVDVGTTNLLESYITGGNMYVRIGDAAPETVAAPTISAGTAGFTLGKDNGAATSFCIDNDYIDIYIKNACPSEADRAIFRALGKACGGLL